MNRLRLTDYVDYMSITVTVFSMYFIVLVCVSKCAYVILK